MKRPFHRVIIMGAVAAALALVLDGCKKEAAEGPDLELNKESIDLKIGETFNLKVTNLHGDKIRWVSEDDEVATVDKNGVVTGIGHGRTIIAAWSNDGGNVAKCKVCVPLKINSLDAPVNYFPVWMGADNPIEYPFATKPEFSFAYDLVWEGVDAVFPGDPSGDFDVVISERAYIKPLKPGLKYIKITPKDSDKDLSVRRTIRTHKHRFNLYPTYSDSVFEGDGLEDGAVIDVSKLDKTTHKYPFLLLRSCSFDWNEADMNKITVDDNDIAKVGGRFDKHDVLVLIDHGTKKGETTLTIANDQVGIRGIVENTYVRKFTLRVP